MIAFLCPGCGKGLKVKDEFAGRKGRCPHCQRAMNVPTANAASPSGENGMQSDGTVIPDPVSTQSQSQLYDFLAPPQALDEIGRLGPYRVLKVLGTGGMGVVFQAEDPKLQRALALKAMLPTLAASGSNKERFLREARAAAAIEHDHIIPIYQVDEERGVPFIAMPLLRGESLESRLRREGALPIPEALRIARETAEGLAAAHERNLIHRDIKPANLWLEGDRGRVKILDFGLARSSRGDAQLTQLGAILGTPSYMAPEQGAGKPVDTRCDLFSLGCVLYRTLTGYLPFKGADTVATIVAVATETPPAPRKLNPDIPPLLSKLVMELLAKNPQDRPLSALSVVDRIEELEREPVPAPQVIAVEAAPRPPVVRVAATDRVEIVDEDEEEFDERPARRMPTLPLLVGGGVGCLALMLIGMVVTLIMLLKDDDSPQVVKEANSPPSIPNPLPKDKPSPIINPPSNDKLSPERKTGNVPTPATKKEDNPRENRPQPSAKKEKGPDKTFKPYSSAVKAILMTVDGKHFCSFADRNTRVDYWDREAGKIVRSYDLGSAVRHCLLSPDGTRLIAFNDSRLLCWDIENGQAVAEVIAPGSMKIVGGGFTTDKNVRAALRALGQGGASGVVIYDYAGRKILPAIDPRTKKSVLGPKKQPVPLVFPHTSEVERVFFGLDCKRFISWSQDHMFRTWDCEEVRLVTTSTAAPNGEKSLAVSHDFKRILGTFHQPNVRVYDVETGQEVKDIKPHDFGDTDAVAFGGDTTTGVASAFGGTLRILDLENGKVKKEIKNAGVIVTAVAFSADGKTLLSGELGGTINVYNVKD